MGRKPKPKPSTRSLPDRRSSKHRARAAVPAGASEIDELATTREAPAGPRLSIMDAGEAVITEKGFVRATVDEISQRAGVTSDVFYGHFAGKGALLRALNERFCEQAMTVTDQATKSGIWTTTTARDVIEVAVRSILDVVIDRQGLVRAVLAHGTTDPALSAGLRAVGVHLTKRLAEVMKETKSPPHERPDERALAFSLLLTVALGHHTILVGDAWSGVSFDRDELYAEMARAVSAYLTASRPPS